MAAAAVVVELKRGSGLPARRTGRGSWPRGGGNGAGRSRGRGRGRGAVSQTLSSQGRGRGAPGRGRARGAGAGAGAGGGAYRGDVSRGRGRGAASTQSSQGRGQGSPWRGRARGAGDGAGAGAAVHRGGASRGRGRGRGACSSTTPWQEEGRCFGFFQCHKCHRKWQSGNSWANTAQDCTRCDIPVYPYDQRALEKRDDAEDDKIDRDRPHPMKLCGKCQQLGYSCRQL